MAEESKQLTKRQQKAIDTAALIRQEPPQGEDMAFTHSILCQSVCPVLRWQGVSLCAVLVMRLVVQAGWIDEGSGPVEQPLPYGAMPRLTFAWISSYALRNKTREIAIGHSANEFLHLMGMDSQGTRHKTLRTQMQALAACRLQLGFKGRTYNGQPVEQFDAWIKDGDAKQLTLWPGTLTLSEGYYNGLIDSAVPLDNRALHVLKGSALALDIYAWLAHRLHRIEGRPVMLYWMKLREQFAQEYSGKNADKDFKRAFMPALKQVLSVYPAAKVEQVKGGLLLYCSPPPIPYKS